MHYELNKLHPSIVSFLKSNVSYGRKDISVSASEKTSICCGGGDGYKGFAILGNLETGECKITWGSWGGANMFNPLNRVDLDGNSYPIPVNGCVITGQIGGSRPTYAEMVVHPDNMPKMLTSGAGVLSKDEETAINAICAYKSGPYRTEALNRIPNKENVIDGLVSKGLLKKTKSGAVGVTTEGKNARTKKPGYI